MSGCATEHHARKVGLGETGYTALMGGGRTKGVGNFLQGGGSGDSTVWFIDMVPFSGNREEVIRDTHRVTETDHREAIEVVKRQEMGDAGGGRHTKGSGNAVGEDLNIETAGNCGSVGGAKSLI